MRVRLPPKHHVCRWSGDGYVKCVPRVWEKSPRICEPCPSKTYVLAEIERRKNKEAA